MTLIYKKRSVIFTLFMLAHSNLVFAEVEIPKDWPRMKAGFIEAQMKMNGLEQTMHLCMTDSEIADAEKNAAKENDCKIQKATRKGNVYFIEMECKDPDSGKPMQMKAETVLISDSKSKTKMVATQDNKTIMQVENTLTRKRACTKVEEERSKRLEAGSPTSEDMMEQYKDILGGENAQKLKEMMNNLGK